MKKILLSFVMAASALAAQAQTAVETGKFTDNWYIGIGGGVATPMDFNKIFPVNPVGGISVGKQISPAFALEVDGAAFFGSHGAYNSRWGKNANGNFNAFRGLWLGLNSVTNLTDLFMGYKGIPRNVELSIVAGMGWEHAFTPLVSDKSNNTIAAKTGFDIDFNLGESKASTIRVQPYILWDLQKPGNSYGGLAFNRDGAQIGIDVKYIYHFKNAQDTHYFKAYDIAAMNAIIARLNTELAKKPTEVVKEVPVEKIVEKVVEKPVEVVKTITKETQLAPVVIFQLGKSTIDASQKPSVAMIATYMKNHPTSKVAIYGYASPEGNAELNQKLSDARAKAVYDMLVNTYKIAPSRLTHKGLGVTDELFDENDWNRVATFIEQSK
ncbi:MAG: OmpA family protein [Bacteroidaceae bacterium]|nr:OmpA family protein [Bacteroidaceae bacterium]